MKIFLALILTTLILAVLICLSVKTRVPGWVHERIEQEIKESCPTCQFQSDDFEISYFPRIHLVGHDVLFENKKPQGTQVKVDIKRIEADVEILALLKHQLIIDSIKVDEPKILLTDPDSKSQPNKKSSPESHWFFELRELKVKDAQFIYARVTHDTKAELHIHKISAELAKIDSRLELEKPLLAHAKGQIEKSGEVELEVKILSLKEPLEIDIEAKAREQNLDDLTPFFEKNAGVILHGTLIKGHSLASLRRNKVDASVWAEYDQLKVALIKTYDRNEVATFFSNLAENLVTSEQNKQKAKNDQTSQASVDRKPGQSIPGVFLQAMKDAALQVTYQ